jgi:hypothetical protein
MVTVTPPALTDPNVTAKLDFYGTSIVSQAGNSAPTAAPWPGSGSYQMKITVTSAAPAQPPSPDPAPAKLGAPATPPAGAGDTSTLVNKTGVWALFHLLDEAGRPGNRVQFYSGGQNFQYQFTAPSAANPLNLNALRQFHCPANI